MNRGWLTLFRWRGIPVRAHWSVPVGAVLLGGGLRFDPAAAITVLLLILLHEFGHAVVVRARGLRVLAIDVHGFGGLCRWAGDATRMDRALIAWGGVWAQLVAFAAAMVWFAVHPAETSTQDSIEQVLTVRNLVLVAINLLPVPPLDGADAWTLPVLLVKRLVERNRRTSMRGVKRAKPVVRRAASGRHGEVISFSEARARRDGLDEVRSTDDADRLLSRIEGLRAVDASDDDDDVRAKKAN